MKKFLSVLSIITILSMMTPAFADPGRHSGPGGPGGGHHRAPHHISAGHHHRHSIRHHHPAPPPRIHNYHHHGAHVHVGGVLARRSYWGYPYGCDYRLGWCDDYYYSRPIRPYYGSGVYVNLGIPIRF